ncbi:MAG TPA: glycerophosphodiester phosphodiesterase [Gemmatimonadales bacterium]|nr:glycerophosphodiester phosphodiesterase [Gemmatimonadales bacterium]
MNPLLDPDARLVIAHRGASAEAPENTLPAFETAVRRGADAIELDVRLTADGAPVVIHDATLDRTTNQSGPVSARTLAELRLADAGWGFTPDAGRTHPLRGGTARIPTLGEVLWAFPKLTVLVEIKEPAAQEAVRRVLLQEDAADRCVVASEHQEALRAFEDPPFARGASAPEISALYRAVMLRRRPPEPRYRFLSVPLRYRGLPVPTGRFVSAARANGCAVHVWTVDSPDTARRLWRRGVAGIVTNFPGTMVDTRREEL